MELTTKNKTFLIKIFSREKTLFWFSMWNDSDRRGWKNFLGYKIKNNLFLVLSSGQKSSVWYNQGELKEMDGLLEKKLKIDPSLKDGIEKKLISEWSKISPYLEENKEIESIDEFLKYYDDLVEWWSAMTVVFKVAEISLLYRQKAEKYSEKMEKVFIDFYKKNYSDKLELLHWIAPQEMSCPDWDLISQRKNGCFVLNEKIYLWPELSKVLINNNLELEEVKAGKDKEIKGQPAYPGQARGNVKKILSKTDWSDFKPGQILVAEMTSPDYLPIMKIAKAIITDEGGMTCHAAIASREIKVPCVVGTKIATQVLKDGDEVEVDAAKGIIVKI